MSTVRARWVARLRDLYATQPTALPLATFVVGLVAGWLVLGWVVFPVVWTDASLGDLAPPARRAYVQIVADAFVGDHDTDRARARLAALDPAVVAGDLAALVAQGADPTGRQHATALARGLDIALAPPGTATPAPAPLTASDLTDLTRLVALVVLVAALAAGAALAWAWVRWHRVAPGGDGDRALPERSTSTSRARGAPPWRPVRVDLGESTTARYNDDDERYYQTWLVYDERGGLIGGAGLQAHVIGSVNALDLWFFKREDDTRDADTPIVTIVAPAAHRDAVFRARLGDRGVLPATPGQRCVLEAADLALEVYIEAAEPTADSERLGLASVTLTLTPYRVQPTGDLDDPEPPVPLLFRRD